MTPKPKPPTQKTVFCPRCDKPFANKKALNIHISKHMDYDQDAEKI